MGSGRDALSAARQLASRIEPTHNPAMAATPPTRILLGVTGGIAAYKSAELVRRLVERGAEVQVVMTSGARRFVTPLTFQALSGRPVRSDLWDESAEAAMGHIELARWRPTCSWRRRARTSWRGSPTVSRTTCSRRSASRPMRRSPWPRP